MALPAAPRTVNDEALLPAIDDNGGTYRANVLRGYQQTQINSEDIADLGVYPTSGTLENGAKTLGGGTAEAIVGATLPCQGVLVKAAPTNAATIYVGKSDVTTDYADSTGGFPLDPGESVGVPCRDAIEVYIRGTTGDKVAWIASAD